MTHLASRINTLSTEYKTNYEHNKSLAEQLAERQHQAAFERSKGSVDRQRQRGKLLVRERIEAILDPGSPFLELSPLAAWEMYNGEIGLPALALSPASAVLPVSKRW
jgi:acetyl-CoA carboxylase carboxyltransferase component